MADRIIDVHIVHIVTGGDYINQITSDHGWMPGSHDNNLKNTIQLLKESSGNAKISLFIDNITGVEYAAEMNADLVEIHTYYQYHLLCNLNLHYSKIL